MTTGEPLILAPQIPIDPNLPPMKKRKKRTSIDPKQKDQLDVIFRQVRKIKKIFIHSYIYIQTTYLLFLLFIKVGSVESVLV